MTTKQISRSFKVILGKDQRIHAFINFLRRITLGHLARIMPQTIELIVIGLKNLLLNAKCKHLRLLLLAFLCLSPLFSSLHADSKPDNPTPEEEKSPEEKPLKIGNLSLRTTQQPGPLISFGENIIDQGNIQFVVMADEFKRKIGYISDVIPSILYGLTEKLSLFFNLPIAPRFKDESGHSSGLEDAFIQLEYVFYDDADWLSTDQATFVTNVAFPTGSAKKTPPTGFGSPSFFVGWTYNHTAINWFYFGSLGAVLTTFHSHSKSADQFLYQMGIGHNLPSPDGWIFAWMVEFDGIYGSKNIVNGRVDKNSGGNVFFITPSLWISSEHLVFQIGAGGVLTQHLYGGQSKFTHQIAMNLGWAL